MPTSIGERQRERARAERQREKELRRQTRRADKPIRVPGEDPDIAGIVPGPQPGGRIELRPRPHVHGLSRVPGSSVTTPMLKHKADLALAEVSAAEESLERALRELSSAPRADKVVVTNVVRRAFSRLRTAREVLASLAAAVAATE
jgi:hypothetical protein